MFKKSSLSNLKQFEEGSKGSKKLTFSWKKQERFRIVIG